ncbi:MAG: hypothetical protein WD096_09090 [Actinomycetota bacterium]
MSGLIVMGSGSKNWQLNPASSLVYQPCGYEIWYPYLSLEHVGPSAIAAGPVVSDAVGSPDGDALVVDVSVVDVGAPMVMLAEADGADPARFERRADQANSDPAAATATATATTIHMVAPRPARGSSFEPTALDRC